MERIREVVLHYLEIETQYAHLLTGEWGCGKTYFVEKSLFPYIQETASQNKAEKYSGSRSDLVETEEKQPACFNIPV